MRYLFEREFRVAPTDRPKRPSARYAAELRRELSKRNRLWSVEHDCAHEVSLGAVPAVLYHEDESGNHGNFIPRSYRTIKQRPEWARRLFKVHTSAKRALLSRDCMRRELDSSNSSDALLMNIFCHPDTLASSQVRVMLGIDATAEPVFGFRPGVPLQSGRRDRTEIDMKLGNLLVEAKLTEYGFQTAPRSLIERYRELESVFDCDALGLGQDCVESYQLIRGVLAAHTYPDARFCLICDARRPDLISSWHEVMMAVRSADLRCRMQLLTWQELSGAVPMDVKRFLHQKFGITSNLL